MIGSTSENVVSQDIERASLGGCSLMGSVQQEKVVRRKVKRKKKRDQDLEIREDWKKETVKVFYPRASLPSPSSLANLSEEIVFSGRTNLAQECPSFQHSREPTSNPMGHRHSICPHSTSQICHQLRCRISSEAVNISGIKQHP